MNKFFNDSTQSKIGKAFLEQDVLSPVQVLLDKVSKLYAIKQSAIAEKAFTVINELEHTIKNAAGHSFTNTVQTMPKHEESSQFVL